jgi:hypothetical protein
MTPHMKASRSTNFTRLGTLAAGITLAAAFPSLALSQATGFNQTGAGPFDYNATGNWAGGNINGIWDAGLTVTAGQVAEFSTSTVLTTGLTFLEAGGQNKTLRSIGGATTLTLGGDILLNASGNVAYTFGSTSGSQNLNVDLGGAVRTVTAFGSGNSANFGKTVNFTNNVFNGGIIASGGGSGGGKIQFNGLAIALTSAEVRDADMSFNGSGNSSANSVYTISGALTGGGGAGTVSVLPKTSATARNALVTAGSFARNAGSTVLFRGTNLGTTTIASATGGVANIAFTTAPTLSGALGGSGTTVGIIAGAFGDTSGTGSGFGATGGLVTYDAANGVRLLSGAEYKTSITDGQTQLDNVRISNSSGVFSTTTLTTSILPVTTINSLSLDVSGATGNQGITITGDPGTTLKINSGVIYAYQNVTVVSGSPASTDAMTISAPTLDLNGQEGIILVSTKMNSGGTVSSNGGLFITSTITNGTGLTIADSVGGNTGYVVLGGASANTYTGNTTINGAVVQLNKSTANTFGDIVLNLGSLYNTGNQIADTANVTINGGVFYLNGSNNSGSATNETINNLTMGNGTISPGSGSGNTFNVNGNASLSGGIINMMRNAKLNIGGTTSLSGGVISVGDNNSASVYNSKTTLTGAVSITNTVVGTAAYTPITIAAGAAAGNLGGQVELTGDLTFIGNTNTNTVTIAAPTGTGLQGVMALNGVRTFDIGNGAAAVDLTVNAPLINGTATGGLTKTGAGTLALNGTNLYTGATTVTTGTLSVSGSIASSAATVGNGATLALSGTGVAGAVTVNSGGNFQLGTAGIAGAVTVNSGTFGGVGTVNSLAFTGTSTFGPGNSPGTVTIANGGTFALSSGTTSTFQFTDSGFGVDTFDLVTTSGTASGSLDGILNLDFTGSGYTAGSSVTIINLSSITGTFSSVNVTGLSGLGLTANVTYNNGAGDVSISLVTSSVPEPSTYALLGGFGTLLFAFGYRARARRLSAV